jgi:hypothetical protein
VTQKHTSATYSVAACLSRIADTEWVRSCEEVRRFSPTVGQLGEWRSLCEGGWTGSIPQGLPSFDDSQQSPSSSPVEHLAPRRPPIPTMERQDSREPRRSMEQKSNDDPATTASSATIPYGEPYLSQKPSNTFTSAGKQSFAPSPHEQNTYLDPPKAPFAGNEKWMDSVGSVGSVGSVASLSSFPSPPTHVPIPPTSGELDAQRPHSRPLPTQPRPASTSPRLPPLSQSPKSWTVELGPTDDTRPSAEDSKSHGTSRDDLSTPPFMSNSHDKDSVEPEPRKSTELQALASSRNTLSSDPRNSPSALTPRQSLHISEAPQGIEKPSSPGSAAHKQQGDYAVDEFGVDRGGGYGRLELKSVNAAKAQELERKASAGSTSSIVAAMRSRYANPVSLPLLTSYHSYYSPSNHRVDHHHPRRGTSPVYLSASTIWRPGINPQMTLPRLVDRSRHLLMSGNLDR